MTDTPVLPPDNEAETIAELAFMAAEPIVQTDHVIVVRDRDEAGATQTHVVDLTAYEEKHQDRPARIRRSTALGDVDSFLAYLGRYWHEEQSLVYRTGKLNIVAVLDADPIGNDGIAAWGSHKVLVNLRLSDRLMPWRENDRELLIQQHFVEFLEDHIADVVDPDAADLIELVQWLSGHTSTNWSSAISTKDGARRLTWEESMTAGGKVRTGGSQDIPGEMTIRVPLFQTDREDDYIDIVARLRIRVRDGKVTLGFILDNLDSAIDYRMRLVLEAIENAGYGPVLTAATV